MTKVMTLDRICDGLMGVPFIIAVFLRVRAEQFKRTPSLADLEHAAGAVDTGPRDRSLFLVHTHPESTAENVKIVLFFMVNAARSALLKIRQRGQQQRTSGGEG